MEYKRYILKDIADIRISGVDKKTNPGEKDVRLCNFVDVYKNWAITSELYDSFMKATAKDKEIEQFTIRKGQVAITKDSETRDDIGISTYIQSDFTNPVVLGYHTALITPNEQVLDGRYLNLLLHTKYFADYWFNNASGSGMRYTLSEECINEAVLYLPDIEHQRQVGKVFESINDKITLNRRENALLEKMAKELYDYWFVQFDFPDEEGEPYRSSGGKMVWNGELKREVPEGWNVSYIGDCLSLAENGEWGTDSESCTDFEIHCIRGADIVDLIGAPKRYLPNNKVHKLLAEHDIIIEISGGSPTQSTGRSNYVTKEILEMYNNLLTCSNFCKFVRLKDVRYASYFFHTWRLIYENGNMFHYEGKTSGIRNLQIESLLKEYWSFPPIELVSEFHKRICLYNCKIGKNKIETENLKSLRNFLLPILMNGQVRIKE